ncbi:MAG: FHA domain-containing protein [Actinobacteria bacterium]|nr:MAG: FHA domain-containing protein [Actinomycetota bacterium]
MTVASTRLEEVLLALKIAFLVLLYLLIWRIIRTVSRDMRTQPAQESFIMPPVSAAAIVTAGGRLIVEESPVLDKGDAFTVDSAPLTVGRSGQNDVAVDGDEFASARHVRFEPRRDGVWVQDLGSTNGTYVNGVRIDGARRLAPGDVVRVGETDLRFDA